MAKKKKLTKVYIVVDNEGIQHHGETYEIARQEAIDIMEEGGKDEVMILEVTGAWQVIYPEEPLPEVDKVELENL